MFPASLKENTKLDDIKFPYASFNRRIHAMTIDILIFVLLSAPIMGFASYLMFGDLDAAQVMGELRTSSLQTEVKFEDFWAQIIKYKLIPKFFLKSRIWLPFLASRLLDQFKGRNSRDEVNGECLQQC